MVKSLSIPHAENIIRSLSESYQDYPYPGGMIRDTIRRKESLPIMWREELKRIAKIIDITTESPKAKGVAIWCRLKDMESTSAATFSQFISLSHFWDLIWKISSILAYIYLNKFSNHAESLKHLLVSVSGYQFLICPLSLGKGRVKNGLNFG